MLRIIYPDSPALVKLLVQNTRLVFIKRTRIWRDGGREISVREVPLAGAQLRHIDELVEGFSLVTGVIQAGNAGRERSWGVDGMIEVQVSASMLDTTRK